MKKLSFLLVAIVACKEAPNKPLAELAQPVTTASPGSPTAQRLTIAAGESAVTWVMNAPLEIIYGDIPSGVSGEIFVDPKDLSKTTGVVRVDLEKLLLSQEKRKDETEAYGARTTQPKQNEHAKQWLEIGPDAPAEQRRANAEAALVIGAVTASAAAGLGGPIRAEVKGELVLHGRKSAHTVKVEVELVMDGERVKELKVRSLEPMIVSLEAHDVRPREAFGKLAAKTLEAMGNKVAKEAPIDVRLVAR